MDSVARVLIGYVDIAVSYEARIAGETIACTHARSEIAALFRTCHGMRVLLLFVSRKQKAP